MQLRSIFLQSTKKSKPRCINAHLRHSLLACITRDKSSLNKELFLHSGHVNTGARAKQINEGEGGHTPTKSIFCFFPNCKTRFLLVEPQKHLLRTLRHCTIYLISLNCILIVSTIFICTVYYTIFSGFGIQAS